ncbi:hypothetical protein [Corynebacterium lizhenjunii]|uniref:hypothetical protein n=1 Tax=Corynebacterium lizhenjunii TaxID=2709394 RepID=UPI0013ED6A2A|nr:hypothetical protein [Corynebacterium lizhenjunii]
MNSIDDLTPEQQERYHELADHWEYITGQLDIPYQPISIDYPSRYGGPVLMSAGTKEGNLIVTFSCPIFADERSTDTERLYISDSDDARYLLEIRLNKIGVERGVYLAKKAMALFRAEQVGR